MNTIESLQVALDATRRDNEQLRAELDAAQADVVRLTTERDDVRKYWQNLRPALIAIAWTQYDNVAFSQRVAADALAIGCPASNERMASAVTEAMAATITRERSRADVLAAEVRDARAWHDTDARSTGQMMELSSNLDKSRAITDRTNALDPAKFVHKEQA
jgi:FtsZ-binding cell division protein ZapB